MRFIVCRSRKNTDMQQALKSGKKQPTAGLGSMTALSELATLHEFLACGKQALEILKASLHLTIQTTS